MGFYQTYINTVNSHFTVSVFAGYCELTHVEDVPHHLTLDVDIKLRVGVKAASQNGSQ